MITRVNAMRQNPLSAWLILGFLLSTPRLGPSPSAQQNGTLIVSGQPGQAPLVQMSGKSYVDVETLARLANGSLSFKGSQITLTLPAADTTATVPSESQPSTSGFSKDFIKAGIEVGSTIREWRAALMSSVQNGYPVTDDFLAGYRRRASTNLRLASVAVSTDSDRSAFQLLSNELDKMQQLSNQVLDARQNMSYMSANALRDDPLNQQILTCARSLAAMAASGQFQDDGSCR